MVKEILNENYLTISGWMINELHLKGSELLAYALIYGFTQNGHGVFDGSSSYLAKWLNISKRATISVLQSLTQKGYIQKIEKIVNDNLKTCEYKAVELSIIRNFTGGEETSLGGGEETSLGGGEETSPNNIESYNNTRDIYKTPVNNKLFTTPLPFENEFQEFWELFPRDRRGNKQKAYKAYLRVLKQKRSTVTQLLLSVSQYAKSEEVKRGFAKGCEAWLNDDRFNVNYALKAQGKKTASDITDDSIREFLRRNSNNGQEGEREYESEFENICNVD